MEKSDHCTTPGWHIPAAIGGWLVPGLGHWVLGERRRGAILAASIGLLWLGGLTIGGVSVCDRQGHTAWFLGQMLIAPSWVVDWYQQTNKPDGPGPDSAYEPSFARVNEQGILYTALAGLLNLLAILDVIYREPTRDTHQGQSLAIESTMGDTT